MKRLLYIVTTFLLVVLFNGCKEEFVGQPATDNVAPGSIRNPRVENLPGGAEITYDLPQDDDLLCVKAYYTIKGVEKNTTSSMYTNSLVVEGFGSTDPQTIKLCCVDRSNNQSDPVEVTINPTTPPVELVFQSMTMEKGFGGVQLKWKNENKSDLTIYVLAADSVGDLNVADVVYTSATEGKYSLHGFDDSKREYATVIRDRWDNYSDTLKGFFTPYFEMKLDKSKFNRQILMGDNETNLGGWEFNKMFDDIVGDQGFHTSSGKTPMYFTIDLGVTAKLSRYTLWPRIGYEFKHHNLKRWKIYGTTSLKLDNHENSYWVQGGFKNDWNYMMDCYSFKPSGEDGPITNEDVEYATQGFEFEFPLDSPPIRYIRFEVESTWSGGDMMHISEISFWGEIKE